MALGPVTEGVNIRSNSQSGLLKCLGTWTDGQSMKITEYELGEASQPVSL